MLIENIYIIHKNPPLSVSTKTVETVNTANASKFQLKTVARQYWQLSPINRLLTLSRAEIIEFSIF